jgi:hypothetical protein
MVPLPSLRLFNLPTELTGVWGAGNPWGHGKISPTMGIWIFLLPMNYNNRFFINDDNGLFTEVTDEPFCTDYGASFAAIWADFSSNGFLDLFRSKQ